ncbi:hypothetical protein LCGC14_2170160, partial [marine sediment metagenome]
MREAAGLNQEQLAKLLKVSKSAISRWESGERAIAPSTADHIQLRLAIEKGANIILPQGPISIKAKLTLHVEKPVTLDEIKEEFPYFGVPFEGISDEGNVSIEVFANRPDNLSVEGLARSYAGFSERKLGLPEYKVEETEPFNVFISENMKKY